VGPVDSATERERERGEAKKVSFYPRESHLDLMFAQTSVSSIMCAYVSSIVCGLDRADQSDCEEGNWRENRGWLQLC
jgi:hypothetical protein